MLVSLYHAGLPETRQEEGGGLQGRLKQAWAHRNGASGSERLEMHGNYQQLHVPVLIQSTFSI